MPSSVFVTVDSRSRKSNPARRPAEFSPRQNRDAFKRAHKAHQSTSGLSRSRAHAFSRRPLVSARIGCSAGAKRFQMRTRSSGVATGAGGGAGAFGGAGGGGGGTTG